MSRNFALLGAGRIGQVHARALNAHPLANLAAVNDAFQASAEAVATTYGCPIKTIDEIAADPAIDGVLICTPTDTHADLIEKFAHAGKAIFCEKPIDLDIDRVVACLDTVKKTGAQLMLGFNRRFDPHFDAVIKATAAGQVGDVEQVTITSRDPDLPPKEYIAVSGGIFRDMMIHDFDIARCLLGEEVTEVQASASALVDPSIRALNDYDTASVILSTASGKQATITNSRRASYGYDQRIEVHGSTGAITANNQRPTDIEIATATGYTRPPLHDFFMTRYIDAYANEITAFVNAIDAGTAPSPSGQDGLAALRLAEAAVKSVETGQRVTV
jgi:myo-inositol 2-dehydrogenase/D-chiro-inositol 1-dehydrogenase